MSEKCYEKSKTHFIILKNPNNLRMKENVLNLMKGIHQNSQTSIMFNDETLELFSLNSEFLLLLHLKSWLTQLIHEKKNKIKGIWIRRDNQNSDYCPMI